MPFCHDLGHTKSIKPLTEPAGIPLNLNYNWKYSIIQNIGIVKRISRSPGFGDAKTAQVYLPRLVTHDDANCTEHVLILPSRHIHTFPQNGPQS